MESEKTLLTQKNILILSAILFITAIGLGVVLVVVNGQKTQVVANKPAENTQKDPDAMVPGQTNPNVVGFGQTFHCEPRSDEEFYRTDASFAIDPKNPQVMYINAEYKGFYKTVDGGQNWSHLTEGIEAYGREDDPNTPCYAEYPYTLIDPNNSKRIILAVSGAGGTPKDFNALPSGILESLDGGESFHNIIKDDMNGYVSSITFDPTDSSILYYGSNSSPASYKEADPNKIFVKTGLVYKLDGQWSELPTTFNPYTGATGVHVNEKNNKEIVVFTMSAPKPQGGQRSVEDAEQMGVLRSNDGGSTWEKTHPLPNNYEAVILHAVSSTNFQKMFVTPLVQGGGFGKSFYSTDSGKTFTQANTYIDFAWYDPNYEDGSRLVGFVWQSMNGLPKNVLMESLDSGASWHEFVSLPAEITNIVDKKTFISGIVWDPIEPNTFYMNGASALVWKTTNNGATWEKILDYTKLN